MHALSVFPFFLAIPLKESGSLLKTPFTIILTIPLPNPPLDFPIDSPHLPPSQLPLIYVNILLQESVSRPHYRLEDCVTKIRPLSLSLSIAVSLSLAFHLYIGTVYPLITCNIYLTFGCQSAPTLNVLLYRLYSSLCIVIFVSLPHCHTNNLNLRFKIQPVTAGPDATGCVWFLDQRFANKSRTYTVASAPAVIGSVFMPRIRLL